MYSLYAKYLPKSTFYSFEPFPETYKLLNDNLLLNNINNVNTYNLAISDKNDIVNLYVCTNHNGLHTLGNNLKRFDNPKVIKVNSTTLDDFFFKNTITIDYIKIDTEGYEYFILKGGINTIKKYKPIIQLEWNITNMEQCNVTENMLIDFLNEVDYVEIGFVEEEKLYKYKYN